MKRILVVGSTGSGKTTLAATLAHRLSLSHVELDALYWEPNWVEADAEVFRARALEATKGERWVVCGNYYSKLNDILWARADTIVWLDLALPLILWRVLRRTVSRSVRRTELWSGNRETFAALWGKDALWRWALLSRPKHRDRYGSAMRDPRWAHLTFVHLRTRREVRLWLDSVLTGRG